MTATYHISPNATWREVGGEIVILDVEQSVYFSLNGTGGELWKLMAAGGATLEELERRLVDAFGAEVADPNRDAREFVESCGALVVRREPSE